MKSFASISIITFWFFTLFLNCLSPKVEAQTQTQTCIQILDVRGFILPNQTNPTELAVVGRVNVNNCPPGSTVTVEIVETGQSASAGFDPSTGDFVAVFQQLNKQVSCNTDIITIKAWCTADATCKSVERGYTISCVNVETCSIQIYYVNKIVIPGQTNPQLRVMGRAKNCSGLNVIVSTNIATGPIPMAVVDPSTNIFVVTFPIQSSVSCGDKIRIEAWCANDSNCKVPPQDQIRIVKCCEIPGLTFKSLVPSGSLTPNEIQVSGILSACSGDEVIVEAKVIATNALIGRSLPTLIKSSFTREFYVSLPVPPGMTLDCDDSIRVKAWCAVGSACPDSIEGKVDCGPCPRVQVSATYATCTGSPPTQPVTLKATISIPAGQMIDFYWDYYGDGSLLGPTFTVDNSRGTGANQYPTTDPGAPHNYAPGTWQAKLKVVNPLPEDCPSEFPLQVVVQCGTTCPIATVSKTGESCVDGKRMVTLEATVTAPANSPAVGQWNSGPSGSPTLGPIVVVPSGQTQIKTTTFEYPPGGPYKACIMWDRQSHPDPTCTDACTTFSVASCPPPVCDDVKLTYSPDPVPCISTGVQQRVNFVATFDPKYTGPFFWEVNQVNQGGSTSLTGVMRQDKSALPNPEKFDYPFQFPGSYIVTVVVTPSPQCTDVDAVNIQIDDCCPKFSSTLSAFQGATPCDRFFAAQVKNPNNAQLSFEWDFGDGKTKTTTTAGVSHAYNTSGQMRVRVVVNAQGCTDTLITFIDVACQPDTPPTVTGCSVSAGTPGTITVTFSEDVDQAAAQDRANYAITVNGQTVPPTSITSISYDPASNTTTINGVTINPDETVTVTVTGVPDMAGNVIVGNNVTTCSPSDEPPTVVPNCSVTAGQPGTITVTFSEDVDQTAAQDPANYEIRVNGQKVAPSSISYSPNTATINGVSINPLGVVTVKVTGVRDKAGNVIVANEATNVSICMATPPVVKPPNGRPQWPDWLCGILLVLALLALAVALIAAFIWGCTLASGNPVSLVTILVPIIAFAIFVICILLWGFFCASAHCGILCALITTVDWLIGITFVAVIILWRLGNPCALGALFDTGLLGFVLVILIRIAQAVGCLIPVWPSFLCP